MEPKWRKENFIRAMLRKCNVANFLRVSFELQYSCIGIHELKAHTHIPTIALNNPEEGV